MHKIFLQQYLLAFLFGYELKVKIQQVFLYIQAHENFKITAAYNAT